MIDQISTFAGNLDSLLPDPEKLKTKKPYSISRRTYSTWIEDIELTTNELGDMKVKRYFGTSGNGVDFYIVQIGETHYILRMDENASL